MLIKNWLTKGQKVWIRRGDTWGREGRDRGHRVEYRVRTYDIQIPYRGGNENALSIMAYLPLNIGNAYLLVAVEANAIITISSYMCRVHSKGGSRIPSSDLTETMTGYEA